MSPTEILADQHFENFVRWFKPLGIEIRLLVGRQNARERREQIESICKPVPQIVVGTHALISPDVQFANLGLCIIDEQHRFGVSQRSALKEKANNLAPHVLAMTATPIPRSLALTLYSDLAVSVIDELPPGRRPTRTKILRGNISELFARLITRLRERDEKAYVVYPLVEESEKIDLEDATNGYKQACALLGHHEVALLHGKMRAMEKVEAMKNFTSGPVRVLISTTVIEVGVDVPDATAMIVIHAERFGLSQLHQLRGRVGRADKEGFCFLLTHQFGSANDASRRLNIMEQTNDGFRIASEDLAIRGPGDFLGTRQSGLMNFRFCDLIQHADLIEPARDLAMQILQKDADLSHPELEIYQQSKMLELS